MQLSNLQSSILQQIKTAKVEWKPLGEVAKKISSGGTPKTEIDDYYNGDIPWLRTQEVNFNEIWDTDIKITNDGLKNSNAKLIPANCVIVAMYGATVGRVGINKIPMATNQACANIELDENVLNYKYLFHYLSSQYQYIKSLGTGSQTNINAQIVKKLLIPIPPLPLQHQIAEILDKMTALTDTLKHELSLRQKQYAYYRDLLLTFGDGVEWRSLGEVVHSIRTGLNPRSFFQLNTADAKNYYVTIRELQRHTIVFSEKTDRLNDNALKLCNNRSNLEVGDVLFSGTGTIGTVAIISEQPKNWNIKEGVYTIKPKQEQILPKFLLYLFETQKIRDDFLSKSAGGTVKSVPMKELAKIKIPIPPLETQNKIVAILDKFDTLTNSIADGLPCEIELRQKQYEYYREKLLNFNSSDN